MTLNALDYLKLEVDSGIDFARLLLDSGILRPDPNVSARSKSRFSKNCVQLPYSACESPNALSDPSTLLGAKCPKIAHTTSANPYETAKQLLHFTTALRI